jgi:hypothetical protein
MGTGVAVGDTVVGEGVAVGVGSGVVVGEAVGGRAVAVAGMDVPVVGTAVSLGRAGVLLGGAGLNVGSGFPQPATRARMSMIEAMMG